MKTSTGSPELARATEELHRALDEVDGGARNPVGAARALQRVAARHSLDYATSRDAFRRNAEIALRPYFSNMSPQEAAKAVAWLALDAAWARSRPRG